MEETKDLMTEVVHHTMKEAEAPMRSATPVVVIPPEEVTRVM